jgi:hypothetical protein
MSPVYTNRRSDQRHLVTLTVTGQKVDLSQAERNAMKRELAGLVEDYLRGVLRHVRRR